MSQNFWLPINKEMYWFPQVEATVLRFELRTAGQRNDSLDISHLTVFNIKIGNVEHLVVSPIPLSALTDIGTRIYLPYANPHRGLLLRLNESDSRMEIRPVWLSAATRGAVLPKAVELQAPSCKCGHDASSHVTYGSDNTNRGSCGHAACKCVKYEKST